MDRTFKTASGAEYHCPYLSTITMQGQDIMYISVDELTFTEAAALFSNPNEMCHIEYADYVLDGYTHLDFMAQETYGIKAQMSIPRG